MPPAVRLAPLALLLAAVPSLGAQAPRVTKAVGAPAAPSASAGLAPMDAIVAAERAYAQASETRGFRDASLASFADDGVVFRERIALAKPYYAAMPPMPGLLTWMPAWGAVSASGDLGFTTGPFTYRAAPGDTAASTGQFASVWMRQPDGAWKVLADIGASGPAMPAPTFIPRPLASAGVARSGASSAAVAEGQRAMLLIADRGLAAASRADGLARAIPAVSAPDVRLIWPDAAPTIGRDSVAALLTARAARQPGATYEWQTSEARLARAGDLGVTWGTYVVRAAGGAPAEQGSYLRVWTREGGGWQVLLDALSPTPSR